MSRDTHAYIQSMRVFILCVYSSTCTYAHSCAWLAVSKYVWHDWFTYVIWYTYIYIYIYRYTYVYIHPYMYTDLCYTDLCSYIWVMSYMRMSLVMCRVTCQWGISHYTRYFPHLRHDWFMCVTWHIYTCDMIHICYMTCKTRVVWVHRDLEGFF